MKDCDCLPIVSHDLSENDDSKEEETEGQVK